MADSSTGAKRCLASAGTSLVTLWPNLRYFSLGVLLAWTYLVVDFGAWMTVTDAGNLAAIDVAMHVYLVSAAVLIAGAFFQQKLAHFFQWRRASLLIAGMCVVGVLLLIASGPRFLALWGPSSILFQGGSIFVGIGLGLLTLFVARLYAHLEPSKVFLYAALSELLVAIIFYLVIGNSWFTPVPDGPPLSNLLSVVLLPVVVVGLASLPEEAGKESIAPGNDLLTVPLFFKALPLMIKLMVAVCVFSAVSSVVRNFFMLDQPPDVHQLNSQQAMLLRLTFAILLICAALFFLKSVGFGRLYLLCMAALALVVAALPLLNLHTALPLVFTAALSSVNSLIVWCLLSFVAKSGGFSPVLVFGLGEGFANMGLGVGYLYGYWNVFDKLGANPDGIGTPFAVLLIALILGCFVLVFTEKDLDEILEASGANQLNIRDVLMRERNKLQTRKSERPWEEACEIVGKRAMLSDRERELLLELSRNRTPQEIASQLSITVSTVRTHTHKIYVKLDVHSRDQLISLVRDAFDNL